MAEEKPKNCKALITTTTRDITVQPNTSLSPFKPQPKIKIKIPKLLVNTILQRRNHKPGNDTTNNGDQRKSKKKWTKKLSSIIHSVFGDKNSKGACSCSGGNDRARCRVHGYNVEEAETGDVDNGDRSFEALDYSVMSKSRSLKEILEIEDHEMGKSFQIKAHRESFSMDLNSFKEKNKRANTRGDSCCSNGSNGGVGAVGKHESSSILYRAPSRRVKGNRVIRRGRSTRKKATKLVEEEEEEEEESDEDEELCKKRILMGERCRPLHLSGTLSYDKNGILLPEELPCEEL